MMTPISQILTLPDKCPVKQVQGKVTAVYDMKTVAGKPQQRFLLEDAGGNKLYVTAWEHENLSSYTGKEVIISEGPKGGLSVNVYNSKTSLNLSRTCTFQLLAVHQAQTGAAPVATLALAVDGCKATPVVAATTPINGAKVGMALNNAVLILQSSGKLNGLDSTAILGAVGQMASDIIRLSAWMEAGHLYPKLEKEDQPF